MKIKKTILASAIMALTLVGCGTEQQDGATNPGARSGDNNYAAAGIVVDGPITRASVYYDLNGNLKKDSYEPGALTDNNGQYNHDLINGINYCDASTSRPEFCLEISDAQANEITSETEIIITGGYDLYTGEPFEGTMSFPAESSVNLGFGLDNGNQATDKAERIIAITPLTSLLTAGGDGFWSFMQSILGISETNVENLVNLNFLESAEKFNAQAFSVTYQMHKYVTVTSDWVKERYPAIEEGEDVTSDISGLIYLQFTDLNNGNYSTAWNAIRADINELYSNAELSQPSAPNSDAVNILAARLTAVNSAVIAAFGNTPNLGSELTFDNVKGRTRGVEVVVLKIIRGESEGTHISALAALSDATYLTNLEGDAEGNFNFTQLVEVTGTPAEIIAAANAAKSSAGSSLSSDLAGKSLEFSSNSVGLESSAAIFFTGEEDATRGNIHLCLKYLDADKPNDRLEGDYISGTWETLPALNNTVMLGLNYVGYRAAVLKKIGTDGNTTDYRFEFAGEITKFNGDKDFDDTAENVVIPTDNDSCKAYLNNMAQEAL